MPLCTRDDGSIIEFIPSKEELYYYDFTHSINRKKEMGHTMIVNTVEELKRNFSKREIEVADKARRMYVMMGRPLDEIFESLIRRGKILNHPITVTDFKNAIKIYGKDLGCIKGKTTWTRTKCVVIDATSGPDQQLKVILSVDIMNFTGIFFFKTVSSETKFITISVLQDKKKGTIFSVIKVVLNLYMGKGHKVEEIDFNEFNNPVHTILVDNEFEFLRQDVESCGTWMNVTAKYEHVPKLERQNRVIKEWARAIVQTLPYEDIPRKKELVIAYWLNNISKAGQDYSPHDLVFGEQKLDFNNVCQLPFGAYAQVHDDLSITKIMESRTTGAINLGPTRNIQGTHKFCCLKTGEIIVRRKWNELPMPTDVIKRLKELTADKNECNDDFNHEDESTNDDVNNNLSHTELTRNNPCW
jgi:hypothetical protein